MDAFTLRVITKCAVGCTTNSPYFVSCYWCWLAATVAGEYRPVFTATAFSCPVNNFCTLSTVQGSSPFTDLPVSEGRYNENCVLRDVTLCWLVNIFRRFERT